MKRTLLLLPLLLLAACSNSQLGELSDSVRDKSSIVGGKNVEGGSFVASSTVALIAETEEGGVTSICSGVLISNDLVLTAAHCVTGDAVLYVSFGVSLPTSIQDDQVVALDSVVTNDHFKILAPKGREEMATTLNDLAVLKLADPVPVGFSPARLLSPKVRLAMGYKAVAAGFGIAEESTKESKDIMQYAEVTMTQRTHQFIVADQTNGRGACKGDSGGPAFFESPRGPVLVGVTRGSHGGVSDCHHYAEFTYVPAFKVFLLKAAKMLEAESPQFVMY
ncbi:MAG: S1 family peptidase [Bacillota bacterium]